MQITRMRQERIKNSWTLEYVASETGITNQAVSKIELGKSNPSYEVLVKLEKLFKLPHQELLESKSQQLH